MHFLFSYLRQDGQSRRVEKVDFDKERGKFIVPVDLTPEEYGILAQEDMIAEIKSLEFEKGRCTVPVFMSPQEYAIYAKEKILPFR